MGTMARRLKFRRVRRAVRQFVAVSLVAFGMAEQAAAAILDLTLQLRPSLPASYQSTTLLVEGTSTDGCLPTLIGVTVDGGAINVLFYHRQIACPAVVMPWNAIVELGDLPPGDHTATIRTSSFPPPYPDPFPRTLGAISFTVSDRVGGVLHGGAARKVVCRNLTTGQKVIARGISAATTNCEAAGLLVQPGDRIEVRMRGIVP